MVDSEFGKDIEKLQICKSAVWHCLLNSVPLGGVFVDQVPVELAELYQRALEGGILRKKVDIAERTLYVPTKDAILLLTAAEYLTYVSTTFELWTSLEETSNIRMLSYGPFFITKGPKKKCAHST